MLKQFRVKIRSEWWNVYLLKTKTFNDRFSDKTWAITVYDHNKRRPYRALYFKPGRTDKATIIHELVHAYMSYVDTNKKSYAQMEEIFADFFPRYMNRIISNYKTIKKRLKR